MQQQHGALMLFEQEVMISFSGFGRCFAKFECKKSPFNLGGTGRVVSPAAPWGLATDRHSGDTGG